MGAGVTGIGSSKIRIEGVPKLRGAQHRLGGDYIEAGSWAVVGAITGGEIAIEGCREEDIEVVAAVMQRMNVQCGARSGIFEVKPSKPIAVRRITTGLWPSFLSDLVSLVTVLATQAAGVRWCTTDAGAAPVRARADERHGRRHVPRRCPSHHRHRPDRCVAAARSTAAICGLECR